MTISALRLASGILLRTVAVLLIGMLVALGIVLTTNSGARWAVRTLSEHVPGLSVGRIDGTLLRGPVLGKVRYASGEVDIALRKLVLVPDLAPLLRGRVVLERLEIRGGSVNVPPAKGPPPLPEIPDDLAIRSLRVTDFTINGPGSPIVLASGAATLDGPRLALGSVQLHTGALAISGRGELTIATDAVRGSLDADLHRRKGRQAGEPDASSPRLTLSADVLLAAAAVPWHATVRWKRLTWRGSPIGELSSPRGRLVVVPGASPITLALEAELESAAFPHFGSLTADATLRGDLLDLDAEIRALGGQMTASGNLGLAERSGRFRITAESLDASRLDARLAGRVGGHADVTVAAEPVPRVAAAAELHGALRGRPLHAQLRGSWSDRLLELERGEIRLDDGSLELAGRLTPGSESLKFALDVPRTESWYPGLHGALVASGAVRGDSSNPAITVRIGARHLTFDGARIPSLDELDVAVDGDLAAHTVRVRARSGAGVLRTDAGQRWDGEALRGSVVDSTVELPRAGTWTLTGPAEYSVSAAAAGLNRLCYSGPGRSLVCGKLHDRALSVTARQVPSRLAEPWLPGDVELLGAADAELELDWHDTFRGSVSVRQPSLVLRTTAHPDDRSGDAVPRLPRSVELVDVELQGVLADEQFQAIIGAGLANGSDRLEARLKVEPPGARGALSGQLVAKLNDLALLETAWDGVRDLHGVVDVDLGVHGTPAAPAVGGTVAIRSLRASLLPLGVAITSGNFSARVRDRDEVIFEGQLCTEGCVTFGGRMQRPLQRAWRFDARLDGERIAVSDTPELRAIVAPELELAGDRTGWRLTGMLGVEEAAVVASTLPQSAERPAPETFVHGGAADAARRIGGGAPPFALDVRARLGNVRFEGLGLEAELGGALDLARTAGGRLLVEGTAEIEHGTFRVQWQEFDIERGLLIFTGQPENPSLDIRASREVEEGRVGLEITGTANRPVGEVFADAPMSESEALTRLMTGRSSPDGTIEDNALERLARNIGLQHVSQALDRLRTGIGLDELGMDRSGSGSRALIAGERIGNDLLLCYRHGLFDDFTGLELIYGISDRLRLHTKSGSGQSIDLVYEVGPVDVSRPGCRARGARVVDGPVSRP